MYLSKISFKGDNGQNEFCYACDFIVVSTRSGDKPTTNRMYSSIMSRVHFVYDIHAKYFFER